MDFSESFVTGLDGINSHKLRSFLTMLGIIFGVSAVIAMLSIGEGAKQEAIRILICDVQAEGSINAVRIGLEPVQIVLHSVFLPIVCGIEHGEIGFNSLVEPTRRCIVESIIRIEQAKVYRRYLVN